MWTIWTSLSAVRERPLNLITHSLDWQSLQQPPCNIWIYCKISNVRHTKYPNFSDSSCHCLCSIHWNLVISRQRRCSWSSADRRCSKYIWVIKLFYCLWRCALYQRFDGIYEYMFTNLLISWSIITWHMIWQWQNVGYRWDYENDHIMWLFNIYTCLCLYTFTQIYPHFCCLPWTNRSTNYTLWVLRKHVYCCFQD